MDIIILYERIPRDGKGIVDLLTLCNMQTIKWLSCFQINMGCHCDYSDYNIDRTSLDFLELECWNANNYCQFLINLIKIFKISTISYQIIRFQITSRWLKAHIIRSGIYRFQQSPFAVWIKYRPNQPNVWPRKCTFLNNVSDQRSSASNLSTSSSIGKDQAT